MNFRAFFFKPNSKFVLNYGRVSYFDPSCNLINEGTGLLQRAQKYSGPTGNLWLRTPMPGIVTYRTYLGGPVRTGPALTRCTLILFISTWFYTHQQRINDVYIENFFFFLNDALTRCTRAANVQNDNYVFIYDYS